jgi:serine/threonine-protein kinase
MSETRPMDEDSLPLPLARRVDAVCLRFEAAWKAGQRPHIEDFLAAITDGEQQAFLHGLIPLDVNYRRLAGEQPNPEEYGRRFPSLRPEWMRKIIGTTAEPAIAATLPAPKDRPLVTGQIRPATRLTCLRCPHCHNPINLVEEQSDEVLCPACGSSFRVRDARQTTTTQGSRPLGKFQLLERVGLGAFGAVWRARDTELDRIVALKIPHTGLLTDGAELERFHREARAAAQLRHPGIVTVHEVQTLEGLPTLVSDFIDGVPLRGLLEVRRLAFREAAELVADVAEAVDYAHGMGLVHGDLKPANIILRTEQGQPCAVVLICPTKALRPPVPLLYTLRREFASACRASARRAIRLRAHVDQTSIRPKRARDPRATS